MSVLQYIHFSVELWGAIFCFIAIVVIFINKSFDKKGSYLLIVLLLNSQMLMISDALAWIFRGNPSTLGYYMVRISNFSAFFFGLFTLPLVAEYLTYLIKKRSGITRLYWAHFQWLLFTFGSIFLIVNLFHEYIYTFDKSNTYYRLEFGILPGVIATIGIITTFGVVIEYIRYLKVFERVATIIYISFPLLAVLVQMMLYGVSIAYFSIVISNFILFLSYEIELANANSEKERKLAEDSIRLFNKQIHPHFLFNSLSIIKYLCRKSPEEAVKTIDEFAGYMRSSTDLMNTNECVPLEQELQLVKHYTYMQKKRFGDNINYEFDIQDSDFKVPPFSVQTMVENAIEHGIKSKQMKDGLVKITSFNKNGVHFIKITDNGGGFDTGKLYDADDKVHVGINNTAQRLQLMCKGEFDIQSEIGKGTVVTIKIYEE